MLADTLNCNSTDASNAPRAVKFAVGVNAIPSPNDANLLSPEDTTFMRESWVLDADRQRQAAQDADAESAETEQAKQQASRGGRVDDPLNGYLWQRHLEQTKGGAG